MTPTQQFIVDIVTSPLATGLGGVLLAFFSYRFGLSTQKKSHAHEVQMAGQAQQQAHEQSVRDAYASLAECCGTLSAAIGEYKLTFPNNPERRDHASLRMQNTLTQIRSAVARTGIIDNDDERRVTARNLEVASIGMVNLLLRTPDIGQNPEAQQAFHRSSDQFARSITQLQNSF